MSARNKNQGILVLMTILQNLFQFAPFQAAMNSVHINSQDKRKISITSLMTYNPSSRVWLVQILKRKPFCCQVEELQMP